MKCSPAPVTWDKVNWKPWSESWFEDAELNSLSQGNVNWLRKRKRPTVRKKRLLPYRRWKLSLVNQVRFSVSSWSQSKSIRLWKNLEVGVGGARLEVKNLLQAKLSTLKSTLSSETLASPITERKLLEDLRSPLFRLAYSSCLLGGAGSFLRKWKAIVPSTTCPACVPGSYS